jgi:DNA polymerase III alpha subunit
MDIDVDVASSTDPLKVFKGAVRASMLNGSSLTPHPCGVYFQDVPKDPLSGLSAIPFKTAEELGYFKLDFLHVNVYDHFTSHDEIKELIKHDPDWNLLSIPSVVSGLFQISKHYDLISELKPRSIIELADCLALIRPQKRYLLKYYREDREKTREFLYKKEIGTEGYAFKKAHAIAYALVIVLQLHLVKAGIKL